MRRPTSRNVLPRGAFTVNRLFSRKISRGFAVRIRKVAPGVGGNSRQKPRRHQQKTFETPVIASGGPQHERSEGWGPERSNPLPVAKRAKPKRLAQHYFGLREGIASLRQPNLASLVSSASARNDAEVEALCLPSPHSTPSFARLKYSLGVWLVIFLKERLKAVFELKPTS